MADIWEMYARPWNDQKKGFGRHSYAAAIAAGFSNEQIQQSIAGRRLGQRARDMINAGVATERTTGSTIQDYKSQLDSYKNQMDVLQSSYNQQLQATQTAQKSADEFQEKFQKMSGDYEVAKAEADTYREQAVGQQLRAIRSGATATGGNETISQVGGLTGGRQAFSGSKDKTSDITEMARAESGLTDSVLSNKGPVVQRIATSDQRQKGKPGQPNSSLSQGAGSGSYYASRFG